MEPEPFPRGRGGDAPREKSDFPRSEGSKAKKGPASEPSATPKRKRTAQAEETLAPATDVKPKKAKVKTDDSAFANVEPSFIEPWRFKNVKALSTHFLGVIREIHDLELVVSLPNNLTGFVPITEISDLVSQAVEKATSGTVSNKKGIDDDEDMKDDSSSDSSDEEAGEGEVLLPSLEAMFTVGQLVRCVVTEVEGGKEGKEEGSKNRRRIELSINPAKTNAGTTAKGLFEGMVLAGTITSKEDHGYMVDLGVSKVSCFLHDDNVPGSDESTGKELLNGQPVLVSILTLDKGHRAATCTLRAPAIGKNSVSESTLGLLQLDLLRPGLLVNARVKTVDESGLRLTFGGLFSGTVHYLHLPAHPLSVQKPVSERYKVDQKLRARVLAVDIGAKTVSLTLKDSLVNWNSQAAMLSAQGATATAIDGSIFRIGGILETVTVISVDGNNGLFVGCGPAFGYVHVSRLSDTHLTKIPPVKFAAGTTHRGRIMGFDVCDELVQLSFQPSVLEQPFVSHWDMQPGMAVSGEIVRLIPAGAVVKLTDTITGLVPTAQLSDVKLQHPEKLFKAGQALKLRITSVEPKSRKVLLTNRKTLVQDSLPVLNSYESAVEGAIVQGTIIKIEKWGCLVAFYGNVKGILPVSALSTQYVESPTDLVKMGQIVKCRIVSCNPADEKLRLSMLLTATSGPTNGEGGDSALGDSITGRVISKTADAIVLQLDASKAIATLPKHQLAETPLQQAALFDRARDGVRVDDVMVLHADKARSRLTVTANPVFKAAVATGLVPDSFDSVEEGSVVVGYVKNLTDYGVFIGFLEDLVGYAKKQDICPGYAGNPSAVLWMGRTVAAKVVSVDRASRRFGLTLVDVPVEQDLETTFVDAVVRKQDEVELGKWSKSGLSLESKPKKAFEVFPVGSVVKGVVKEIGSEVVKIELNNGLHGNLAVANFGSKSVKAGQKVLCRALRFDADKQAMDVVLADDAKMSDVTKDAAEVTRRATVRLVRGFSAVLELDEPRGAIAFASTLELAPRASPLRVSVGQSVAVSILRLPEQVADGRSFEELARSKLLVKIIDRSGKSATEDDAASAGGKRRIQEPIDPLMTNMEDYSVGRSTKGKIKSVKGTQLNVTLATNLRGRVHICEVFDDFSSISDPKKPLSGFKTGDTIDCKVVGMLSSKNHKFLPISHRNPVSQTVIELTLRPRDLSLPDRQLADAPERPPLDMTHVKVGDLLPGFVHEVKDSAVWVHLSSVLQGRINAVDASKDLDMAKNLGKHFAVGQAVQCRVMRVDADRRVLDLSLNEPGALAEKGIAVGRVVGTDRVKGLVIQLPDQRYGKVALTDIADAFKEDPTSSFAVGELLEACVVGQDDAKHQVDLSLRPSRLASVGASSTSSDQEIRSLADLELGQDVRGYIVNVTDKGAFVSLGRHVTARLKISEISTDYVKDWKSLVHTGQLIAGRIIGIDKANSHVEFSKKALDQAATGKGQRLGWSDLEKGMKVNGVVTKVESFGIFIRIDDSQGISGLCHTSELSNIPVKQIDKLYQPGDAVRAVILKVDAARKRVSFGLKATYFEEELADDDEEMGEGASDEDESEDGDEVFEDAEVENAEDGEDSDDEDGDGDEAEGASDEDSEEEASEDAGEDAVEAQAEDSDAESEDNVDAPLEASRGFVWDPMAVDREEAGSGAEDSSESDDDDEEGGRAGQKKSRRAKRKAKKDKEQEVARREEELLDPNRTPETADDFERLILGSPSSSYIWVKYMAYQLQLGEIDQAREVAERAIKTINFREEAEKLNVWIAYLNLENVYGTQAKLDAVFQRACQHNEAKAMHIRMVEIYEQSGKEQLAEELYQTMVKKFKESCKVWVAFGLFYIKRGKIEESRKVLQRAIQSLAKRKHVKTIIKFAQMEFRLGEPERGRTIFESVVSTYPKRLDIWSIYVDMESGSKSRPGDPERVRKLYERMTSLQLSSKRARDLFKRWLEFEKKEGGQAEMEHVKKKAQTFVQNLAARV